MNSDIKNKLTDHTDGKEESPSEDSFFQWLLAPSALREKLAAIHELWTLTNAKANGETYSKLNQFLIDVGACQDQAPKSGDINSPKRKYISTLLAAAVACALVALVSVYLTKQYYLNLSIDSPEVVLNEKVTSFGKIEKLTLSDGTRVTLNSGSSLLYPRSFSGDSRTVYLVGEGYFEVARDTEKPFYVRSNTQEVKVVGTKFNVSSYPDASDIKTTLLEGQVAVAYNGINSLYWLQPKEQIQYVKESGEITKSIVDTHYEMLWLKGWLRFNNATIEEILLAMERRYDISFQYNTSKIQKDKYTITFRSETGLQDALSILNHLIGPLSYQIDGKKTCKLTFY